MISSKWFGSLRRLFGRITPQMDLGLRYGFVQILFASHFLCPEVLPSGTGPVRTSDSEPFETIRQKFFDMETLWRKKQVKYFILDIWFYL